MTTPAPVRIMVVDDDEALRDLLTDYLSMSGYVVVAAADGVQMHSLLAQAPPDVIVLDLMLPGEDGLSLARGLRKTSDIPILMLSARGEEIDRVVGLEVGADDYLAKPFSPRELLARLRALLRRARPASLTVVNSAATKPTTTMPSFGPFTLDTDAWRLWRDGVEVTVSSGEISLLRIFLANPNRVLSRDSLVEHLKGYERGAYDRSMDVRVTRLRRKIETDPAHPAYIRTVRGEGYLFHPPGEAA